MCTRARTVFVSKCKPGVRQYFYIPTNLFVFSYNPRNNGGKQRRKTEERVNNRITDEGEKCRREEENYVFRQYHGGRGGGGKNISAEKAAENYTFPAPPRFLAT